MQQGIVKALVNAIEIKSRESGDKLYILMDCSTLCQFKEYAPQFYSVSENERKFNSITLIETQSVSGFKVVS
jgi:hypothetical protein